METGLKHKVVLLTGGAGDLGRTCALAMAAEGASIAIADRNDDAVQSLVAEIRELGAPASGMAIDICREPQVARMVEQVREDLGGLDVLVNCAGVFQSTPFAELSLADWERVLQVNLSGMFLCCQAAMRVMCAQRSGRIINIGSLAGQVGGLVAAANYSVSKAGVAGLTKALARAVGSSGVTVNTVNPGIIDSRMVASYPPGQREQQEQRIPLGRLGTPLDVAGAVVFLASSAAAYIHGAHLDVNGGIYMD